MNAEISAFKILNRLEWSSLVLILGLLIGARALASATRWLISHLAERALTLREDLAALVTYDRRLAAAAKRADIEVLAPR